MQPYPPRPAPILALDALGPSREAAGAPALLIQGGDARPGAEPAQTEKPTSSPFGGFGFLPMVLIFAILWFVMIGPERKNRKQREALLAGLKKGDEVMTSGGLYAKVASIQDDVVVLQIAEGVRAKYSRSAIQSVVTKAEASAVAPAD
jgi:preprotein translocase subunit YajC